MILQLFEFCNLCWRNELVYSNGLLIRFEPFHFGWFHINVVVEFFRYIIFLTYDMLLLSSAVHAYVCTGSLYLIISVIAFASKFCMLLSLFILNH